MMTLRAYRVGTRLSNALWLALLAALFVKFCWKPVSFRRDDARSAVQAADDKISRMKSRAARLPKVQTEVEELIKAAAAVQDRWLLKSTPAIGELDDYRKLARKHGVLISEMNPAGRVPKMGFALYRYDVTAQASVRSLENFIGGLPPEGRLARVGNLTLGPADPAGRRPAAFELFLYQLRW